MTMTPPFRILVVDESPAVCMFVYLAVGSDAVSVVGVADDRAALGVIARTRLDLVLATTGLAGPGSQELALSLAARNIPVVRMASSLVHPVGEEGEEDAAQTRVLVKPLQVEHLRALVAQLQPAPPPLAAARQPDLAFDEEESSEADPIADWLTEADSFLDVLPRRWRSLAAENGELHSFANDVEKFRTGPPLPALQFRT